MNITMKSVNVNNKRITDEINNEIIELIELFGVDDIDSIISVTEIYIDEHFLNEISQLNVICDTRNNKSNTLNKEIVNFDVYFQQKNCYNTTKLLFKIEK